MRMGRVRVYTYRDAVYVCLVGIGALLIILGGWLYNLREAKYIYVDLYVLGLRTPFNVPLIPCVVACFVIGIATMLYGQLKLNVQQ